MEKFLSRLRVHLGESLGAESGIEVVSSNVFSDGSFER